MVVLRGWVDSSGCVERGVDLVQDWVDQNHSPWTTSDPCHWHSTPPGHYWNPLVYPSFPNRGLCSTDENLNLQDMISYVKRVGSGRELREY